MDYQTPVVNNQPPQDMGELYRLLAQRQRPQNQQQQNKTPILSWTQVAAGMLNTLADKMHDQKIGGAMQQGQSDFVKALFSGLGNQNVHPGPIPAQQPTDQQQQPADQTQQPQQQDQPTQTGGDNTPTQVADNSSWSNPGGSW